jgi:hypothetical protein
MIDFVLEGHWRAMIFSVLYAGNWTLFMADLISEGCTGAFVVERLAFLCNTRTLTANI